MKIHEEVLNVPQKDEAGEEEEKIKRLEKIHNEILTAEKVNRTLNKY